MEELGKQNKIDEVNAEVLQALANIYISMHVIDLEKDSFVTVKSPQYLEELLAIEGSVAEKMAYAMQYVCAPEYLELMQSFTNLNTIAERLGSLQVISVEYVTRSSVWCRGCMIAVKRNEAGIVTKLIYAVEHIDARKKRELELKRLSEIDGLTNITNRGAGQREITEMLKSGKPGLFCILDVDNFKLFNDKYGHDIGDEVLVRIAECMKETLRGEDCCMRLGGDEFAFFAVGIEKEEFGEAIIHRLLTRIDQIVIQGVKERIEVSIGAVLCPAIDSINFEHVYKKADRRLYANKRQHGTHFGIIWGDV